MSLVHVRDEFLRHCAGVRVRASHREQYNRDRIVSLACKRTLMNSLRHPAVMKSEKQKVICKRPLRETSRQLASE